MTNMTDFEQVAKEAGRAFLREAASAQGVSTAAFVRRLLDGLERNDAAAESVDSRFLYAMASAVAPALDYLNIMERWGR